MTDSKNLVNTEAGMQYLTFNRLFTYSAGKRLKLNEENLETAMKLRTEDGKYNMLAQLLSDDSFFSVRFSIILGKSKADPLYSMRDFGNTNILLSLEKVLEYIDVLNIIQADETNRIVERKDVPLFDADAAREAVINAFVHNNWSSNYAPEITVFSDRMEIMSRGSLPPGQTLDGFFNGDSIPVNEELSRIFTQFHLSGSTGRGVPAIVRVYGKQAFVLRENSVIVTIPFNWINGNGFRKIKADSVEEKKQVYLSKAQSSILHEIRMNPNVTIEQLTVLVGLGHSAVQNNLSFLKKSGFIERVGSNKTGCWRILG